MVPNGPQGPGGGPQPVNPSLLRGNPGIMAPGGQAGNMSQQSFPSLVSPRTQFGSNMNGIAGMGNAGNINNMGLLGNASSLLNHSFGNGVPAGSSGSGLAAQAMNLQQQQQRGGGGGSGMDMAGSGVLDPLLFASSSGQSQGQQIVQNPGNNMASEHAQQQAQQMEATQSFQQQFSNAQQQQQQQQQQAQQQMRAGMGNVPNIKMEQQLGSSDSNGPSQQQQLQQQYQSLRNLASVKLEPQQLHAMRALGPVKLEPNQNSDPALFLQQQQQQQQQQQHQQQQLLQLSRQNSQAVAQMNLLQQQRLLQLQQQQQQQQQQQLLRQLPPQRSQQQLQQQLQQQALPLRSQVKPAGYEPGVCARRLTKYMYQQQHRPADNNIEFWRKFVSDFFAPHAKKRWCVSLYGSSRQTNGVFPQDVWHCEICSRKPGRGFETTVEVLPRLLKIKYDSGTQEELLYVDMPREYHNASGQIVLDYAKAVQESVFEQLRVVREGQLRIVFSSDLKICSWEFCARRHEELIPRRLIVPQVSQLGAVAQKYQSSTQNATSNSSLSSQDLQSTCNSFVASARHLAKALEVPLVNDLGYTKRYVRCLQISEVVNSMKDLIDYSREMRTGPMESLIHFPRRNSAAGITAQQQQQAQQTEDQVAILQNTSQNDPSSSQPSAMQLGHNGNGSMNTGHAVNAASSSTPSSTIAGLLHQNSMNSRHENNIGNVNDPYGVGNTLQIPPASSPSLLPNSQPNPSSPFPSTTSASNNMNNGPQNSLGTPHLNSTSSPANIPVMQQTVNQINEAHLSDSQSSMHHILQEMMSSQVDNSGPLGNDMKGINGITSTLSGGNSMLGNGVMANRSAMNGISYRGLGGIGPSSATGIRSPIPNAMTLNGRIGMSPMTQDTTLNHQQQQQQQDFGNRLLNPGLATVNSFNNMQFNWKPT